MGVNHPGLLLFNKIVNFLCDGAVGLVNTVSVATVGFSEVAVFKNNLHQTAAVQYAAIATDKLLNFHDLTLCDAETSGTKHQTILRNNLQIVAQQDLAVGDLPGVAAAVGI